MDQLLLITPRRRKLSPSDDFFSEGNAERSWAYLRLTSGEIAKDILQNEVGKLRSRYQCRQSGCMQSFETLGEFEKHRFKCHMHQCSVCHRSFSVERLLSIHISEMHDHYFDVLSKKKPSYACLVETCSDLFWSDVERKQHLVQHHRFPSSFQFNKHKKRVKKKNMTESMDVEIESLSSSLASTKLNVPAKIHFGRKNR